MSDYSIAIPDTFDEDEFRNFVVRALVLLQNQINELSLDLQSKNNRIIQLETLNDWNLGLQILDPPPYRNESGYLTVDENSRYHKEKDSND